MKKLLLMAFVCGFALASCTGDQATTEPANHDATRMDQSQTEETATPQPAESTTPATTDKPGGGAVTPPKGSSPKGDAVVTPPKGTDPKGSSENTSERGESVKDADGKNTRDIIKPGMREDNVKNQKDRDVKPVKP